ncbi:MAG TPA: hypothetical protein VKI99_18485 [Candidatus Dormibacteraeota bacterium]|nr:hypothetical protein [Candidatus Dormibacteraeota bacterium]
MENAWKSVAAVSERPRRENEYRRMLALTDKLLGHLELLNMSGQRDLDVVTQRDIARTMGELTARARGRFPRANTVQQALDGLFEVQEELMVPLQRMLHWEPLLSAQIGRSA